MSTGTVAALFVETNGVYYGLPDVDPWDEQRDARLYAGPWPVVAHPPCQRWCRFAKGIEKQYPHYRVGDDGGCFAAALNAVRTYGGVLEHPAHSLAWTEFGLPVPYKSGGWVTNIGGGWSCYVEQSRYGHPMRKATWLYATVTPELRWGHTPDNAMLGEFKWGSRLYKPEHDRDRPRIDREHSATPIAFRDVLLDLARSVSRERMTAVAREALRAAAVGEDERRGKSRDEWEREYDDAVQCRDWQTCDQLLAEREGLSWWPVGEEEK